jgi:hypothetical protein
MFAFDFVLSIQVARGKKLSKETLCEEVDVYFICDNSKNRLKKEMWEKMDFMSSKIRKGIT